VTFSIQDIRQNDTQQNDIQHNELSCDIQHTRHIAKLHIDYQHNGLNCDTQHNNIQLNDIQHN
jgi:hypothetical protein